MTTDQGNGKGTEPDNEKETGQATGPAIESDAPSEASATGAVSSAGQPAVSPAAEPLTSPAAEPPASPAQDLSGWYQASDGQWYLHPAYAAGGDQQQAPQPDQSQDQYPQAQYPQGAYAQPQYPQAQYPQAAYAQGQYAQAQYPPAQYAQAQYSQGQYPPGQYPPGQYPPAGYGSPGYRYVTAVGTKNNGMAIASLICAIGGIFFLGIPSVLGIVFGFVARSQIQRSNGTQTGSGLALAGIIVGFCVVAVGILILIIAAAAAHTCNTGNGNFGSC